MQDKIKSGSGDDEMTGFEIIKHYIEKLFEYPAAKIIAGLLAATLQFCFGPWRDTYGTMFLFVAFDTITGLWYARINKEIIPNSYNLRRMFCKIAIYLIVLSMIYRITLNPIVLICRSTIEFAILGTEVISVGENAEKIFILMGWNTSLISTFLKIFRGKVKALEDGK